MLPVALTIAGSDPSGGAGIQADLKTFHQFGVYGEAVITLLTVQNTRGVMRVEVMDPALVREQIDAVVSDIPPAAAKTGALGSVKVVAAVAAWAALKTVPLVVDPVMISKHGAPLISPAAQDVLKHLLIPHALLVTPNLPEAEALTGQKDPQKAADILLTLGCTAVLIKGGHASGEPVDLFFDQDGPLLLTGRRIQTAHTHGTGCTLSAAITALLASGVPLRESVPRAKAFIQAAIETAPGLGHGHGPLNHFAEAGHPARQNHEVRPFPQVPVLPPDPQPA
jgi:hydroxymethylpyrimidine/phosphomethylpyrimidine kinase